MSQAPKSLLVLYRAASDALYVLPLHEADPSHEMGHA